MMNDFLPIESVLMKSAVSPLSVSQNLSISLSTVIDFEYYRLELIKEFSLYLKNTHHTFLYYFKHLGYLENLHVVYELGWIPSLLKINQKILSVIEKHENDITIFMRYKKAYLHPKVSYLLTHTSLSRLNHQDLRTIHYLTKKYITDLQKIIKKNKNPTLDYKKMKIKVIKFIKKHEDLYAAIIENEKNLVKASEKLDLDEEKKSYLALMNYHLSLMNRHEFLPDDEKYTDDDYGQFVDIETKDSLFVYISKRNDSSSVISSKIDIECELYNILCSECASEYRLFFDKTAFDLRGATGFVNESVAQQDKGIVYQFS